MVRHPPGERAVHADDHLELKRDRWLGGALVKLEDAVVGGGRGGEGLNVAKGRATYASLRRKLSTCALEALEATVSCHAASVGGQS